jgi:molybdopterin converting factor small subunit
MHVNFYADLRSLAGGKTVKVDIAVPTTARAALEAVTNTRPSLAEKIWAAPGELHQHIHVFVNGRQSVFLAQGLETLVQLGDTLDVFPPVGGGISAG